MFLHGYREGLTDDDLLNIQRSISIQFGHKVDLYHSEKHRGILVTHHGFPLITPNSVILALTY